MSNTQQPWLQPQSPGNDDHDDGDDRLVRSGATEVRGDHAVRQDAERATEDSLSDADVAALIREEFENVALANPPQLPGYHVCWLTSNSQYDTISRRQRIGYTPVRRSEMPGYDPSNGEIIQGFEGAIVCNEMILCKIPLQRYQVMMNIFHHQNPLDSESAVYSKIKDGADSETDSAGRRLASFEGEGIQEIERSVKHGKQAGRNLRFS